MTDAATVPVDYQKWFLYHSSAVHGCSFWWPDLNCDPPTSGSRRDGGAWPSSLPRDGRGRHGCRFSTVAAHDSNIADGAASWRTAPNRSTSVPGRLAQPSEALA